MEDVSCWGITSFRHQTGSHEVTQGSSSVSAFTISRLLCHCLCWRKAFSFWGHQLNFVPFLVKDTFWFKTRVIGIEKQKVVYKAKITVISPNRYLIERFSVLPLKMLIVAIQDWYHFCIETRGHITLAPTHVRTRHLSEKLKNKR